MNAPMQPMPMPRSGFLTSLIVLSERARRERIITLNRSEYHELPPAHIIDTMKKDAR